MLATAGVHGVVGQSLPIQPVAGKAKRENGVGHYSALIAIISWGLFLGGLGCDDHKSVGLRPCTRAIVEEGLERALPVGIAARAWRAKQCR